MKKLALIAGALLTAGCTTTPGMRPGAQAEGVAAGQLQQMRERFVEAWRRGDAEGVAAFYTEDATYIGTGGDVVIGRPTILVGLRREVPVFQEFALQPAETGFSNRLGFERGTYSAVLRLPGRQAEPVTGPYLIVYARSADGAWRVRAHMSGRRR